MSKTPLAVKCNLDDFTFAVCAVAHSTLVWRDTKTGACPPDGRAQGVGRWHQYSLKP